MTNNYKQPLQADDCTSDTFGYDVQVASFTFNGQPTRREGITDGTWKFIGDKFIWVTETRTIAQIIADLTAGVVQESEMCPFCPLWENPDLEQQPIGDDFYGTPARVGGIRCCDDCQMALDMLGDEGAVWYVEQAKQSQEAK